MRGQALASHEADQVESWYDTFEGAIKSDNYKGQNSHLLQQSLGYSSMAIE